MFSTKLDTQIQTQLNGHWAQNWPQLGQGEHRRDAAQCGAPWDRFKRGPASHGCTSGTPDVLSLGPTSDAEASYDRRLTRGAPGGGPAPETSSPEPAPTG